MCIDDNGMKIQYFYDNNTGLIQNNASAVEYSVGRRAIGIAVLRSDLP